MDILIKNVSNNFLLFSINCDSKLEETFLPGIGGINNPGQQYDNSFLRFAKSV
jgi:hypothetical protein